MRIIEIHVLAILIVDLDFCESIEWVVGWMGGSGDLF